MLSRFLLGGTFIVFIAVLSTAYFTLPQNQPVVTSQPAATEQSGAQTQPAQDTTSNNTTSNTTTDQTNPDTTGTNASQYTMANVVKHNSASSCWAAINGNVYDLTAWINQHPGGQAPILSLCGTDGSAAFNGQHGGQARPASELKSFLLGPLVK